MLLIIAQVYRLSAVHCQMTRYSQRVPGYLTRYSVSANEISFDKRISQCDCVFQIRLGLEENDSPLHLVTSTGFLKALLDNYSKYDIEICFIFLNDISLAPKMYHCCAGKASWMQCPLHNQKVNKPGFHGASCQLAPFNSLNTQSTVLTNSSVMVASAVYGEWRWQPYQNLLNSVFIPYMSASVIECRSIGSCSSSGLCAGLMITGLHFQLLFTLPPSDTECQ